MYNKKATIETSLAEKAVKNYEGGMAFNLTPHMKLYLQTVSTLIGENKFYETKADVSANLLASIHEMLKIDPEFVLQLALYTRTNMNIRSTPLLLLCEYANNSVGIPNSRAYVSATIQRADELTELIALQLRRNKFIPRVSKGNKRVDKQTPLPMLIKNGVALAFEKFNAYNFAKYDKDDAVVKLRDALFLTHPRPANAERQVLYDQIATKTLPIPETWEVMRSTGKMNWHQVVNDIFHKDGKIMNYMAQLRNLRNCLNDSSVTRDDIILLASMLSDEKAVHYSKQLPFRFLSAYRELKENHSPNTSKILNALETAMDYSVVNIPHLSGTTLIASDVSGSMRRFISEKSKIERIDIGLLLSMMAHSFSDDAITGFFGDTWKVVPLIKRTGILANTTEVLRRSNEVGYSTNGHKVIEYLLDNKIKVDRIMTFTDCQMWDSTSHHAFGDSAFAPTFIKYQRLYPDVKLYVFDLSGYGNIMIPEDTKNVCIIGGWSEKIFDFITAFEESGKSNIIEMIKKIKP